MADINVTLEEAQPIDVIFGEGITNFLQLSDTPNNYTGASGNFIRVNTAENALEFTSSTGAVAWGDITGTLSNQLDLQAALNLKYDAANFNGDFDTRFGTKTTDDLTQGITNLYDQTVAFTGGTNVTIGGVYPNFTVTDNSASSSDLTTHTGNSNIHVDHTTVTLTAGDGLSGGGDISASRTFDLDINGLTTDTAVGSTDTIPIYDGLNKKITFANFEGDINHANILNVGTNTHAQIDTHIADSSIHFSNLSGFDTDGLSEGATNLYYTEARVNANTNVSANTTHRTSSGTDHTFINQDITTTASPTFANISSSNNATANSHVVRLDQLNSAIGGLQWQESVLDIINFTTSEPASPTTGDRYINTATGTSSVTTQSVTIHYIYEWNGTSWDETIPTEGYTVWVHDVDTNYTFNGTIWVEFGSTVSHNNTTGLQGGTTGEYYHFTNVQHTDLTDGGDSTLHFHSTDRNRANHTGTQLASTISDFDTEVSNNTDVAANTSARHDAVTLGGTLDYITLVGQVLTRNAVDLTTDVTGILPNANVADDITLTNITQITNRSHTNLSDIGTNTHAQIDSHISSTSNPHTTTINNLNDTTITAITDNEILQYNTTGSIWENRTLAEADIATATNLSSHTSNTANPHGTDVGNLGSGTLAELNTAITDATLDTNTASRPPSGAAGGDLGGTYPNPTVNDGADSTAIHDNVAGEINAITTKVSPTNSDFILIEDAADANNKKKITIGTLPGAAGGEVNTGSNIGTAGVGVFDGKVGVDLQFKNINAGSNKITVADDAANNEIDIDVTEANLTLDNIGGTLSLTKGGTGGVTAAAARTNLGLGNVTNDAQLPLAGGTMTGNIVAADHGTATTAQVINAVYGTSATPPTASTTTEGTVYFQYSV